MTISPEMLSLHYSSLPANDGFAGRCHMPAIEGLKGRRILDIGCRKGKGAMKLADLAGETGFVVGVDWRHDHVEAGRRYVSSEAKRALGRSPIRIEHAFPESIGKIATDEGPFDVIFMNCSLNLFCCIPTAIKQACDALAPGGRLVVDGVFADGPRDEGIRSLARQIANPIQAAMPIGDFKELIEGAMACKIRIEQEERVLVDRGAREEHSVSFVTGSEPASFFAYTVLATKDDSL